MELFMMTLAGTVVFLAYLLLYFIGKKYFGAGWRYRVLKISLFFFLFPLPYFRRDIGDLFVKLFPSVHASTVDSAVRHSFAEAIIYLQDEVYVATSVQTKEIFAGMAGIVVWIFLLRQMYKYFKMQAFLWKIKGDKNKKVYFAEGRIDELQVKKKISVTFSEYVSTPFVTGILHPHIYIPDSCIKEMKPDEIKILVKHELIHVRHRDLLIQFLAILAVAINWYNPLVYLFFYEVKSMGEIYCDEELAKGKGESFINDYCNLLIDVAEEKKAPVNNAFLAQLVNGSVIALKRRIYEMKDMRKKKTGIMAALGILMICSAGTIPAFAYEEPPTIDARDTPEFGDELNEQQWGEFIEGDVVIEALPYDEFFLDEKGEAYQVDLDEQQSRDACRHSYVSGTYNKHTSIGSGCKIEVYAAQRCTKCSYVVLGTRQSVTNYDKCPHQKSQESSNNE